MTDIAQLQGQFVQQVAARTGIDPSVLNYWIGREGPYAPNGTGGLDFLNLRPANSDVGVASLSPGGFDKFGDLGSSVESTVARIKQPFLQQYLGPALGKGPAAQWDAITQSGWDAGHYGNEKYAGAAAAGVPAAPPAAAAAPGAGSPTPAIDTNAMLANFLIGNVQQHGHTSPAQLLPQLEQLKVARDSNTAAAASPSTSTAPAAAPEAGSSSSVPKGAGLTLARAAMTQLGEPYSYGGPAQLGAHTDCSGLLQASARAAWLQIPRRTYEQFQAGTPVDPNNLEPGDGVFFHMTSQGPSHVGIYIGGGKMIEDPHTGANVEIVNLADYAAQSPIVGARRYT